MIDTAYSAPYRSELLAYYETLPRPDGGALDAIKAAFAADPSLSSYAKKALVHREMFSRCPVKVFPHFPLFFELESGRQRFDWGLSSPAGTYVHYSAHEWWQGKYIEEIAPYRNAHIYHGWSPVGMDHHCLGYEYILGKGFNGILSEILEARRTRDNEFLAAAESSVRALIGLAGRFSEEARRLAAEAEDEAARQNLTAIAGTASRIPAQPAASLRDGLSAILFCRENIGTSEGLGVSTLGHLDWLLGPLYEKEIADGVFTREEAYENAKTLLHALLTYTDVRFGGETAMHETSTTIYIGGCDLDGKPVYNDLTRAILECYTEGRYFGTKLIARLSQAHDPDFADRLAALYAAGTNTMVIQNDEVLIDAHLRQGKTLRDARRYVGGGCHEIVLGGCEVHTRADSWVNVPAILLTTIKKGPFADYDAFYRAAIADVKAMHDTLAAIKTKYEKDWPKGNPCPLYSSTLDDCVARGLDISAGGARYNSVSLSMVGAATFIDSVYGVKEAVFGEKPLCSWNTLADALEHNFEGYEELRAALLRLPKFGGRNRLDPAFADGVLADLAACAGQPNARGGHFLPSFYPHNLYISLGHETGATPDGRPAGNVLSRGITPSESTQGTVTDVLGMLEKLDLSRFDDSFAVDLTLPVGGETDADIIAAIIRAFLRQGGSTLQINVLDVETLKEARRDPSLHCDIVVRVCGYSERFCHLPDNVKNEVIERAVRR